MTGTWDPDVPPPHSPLTSISSSLFSIPSLPHLKRLDTPPPPLSLPLFPLPSPHPTPHDLSPLRSRATRTNAKLKRTSPSPSSSFVHRVNTVVELRQPTVVERRWAHFFPQPTTLHGHDPPRRQSRLRYHDRENAEASFLYFSSPWQGRKMARKSGNTPAASSPSETSLRNLVATLDFTGGSS